MRETVGFRVSIASMKPGPWWLKPLWSFRQQVEVSSTFSDGTGRRHSSFSDSSSHLLCWIAIEATTMANDS
jgi:hypothetical protein